MNQDKMHLINKIFNNETIRTIWDKEQEKYYISVIDIVAVLTESKNPRHYWNVLKSRLKEEGNETVTNCDQLKLIAKRIKGIQERKGLPDVWKDNGITENNNLNYEYKNLIES